MYNNIDQINLINRKKKNKEGRRSNGRADYMDERRLSASLFSKNKHTFKISVCFCKVFV